MGASLLALAKSIYYRISSFMLKNYAEELRCPKHYLTLTGLIEMTIVLYKQWRIVRPPC